MDNAKIAYRGISADVIDDAKSNIVGTISKYIEIKKAGKDYAACCPFHSEKTPSFTVSEAKGIYHCFGCGANGDAIDFVMEHEGITFHEAVKSIVGSLSASGSAPQKRHVQRQPPEEEWKPVVPVPVIAGAPMDVFNRRNGDSWEKLTASKRWAYRDAAGDLIGYISRFELKGGGKDVLPQSFCVNSETGEMRWKWQSFSRPRPLYGLEKLTQFPKAQVVIVEGEKACDAAQSRYEAAGISRDKLVTVSWPGGGKAVKHVDWLPLVGRNVGLWPDADQKLYVDTHRLAGQMMPFIEQPGTSCMLEIAGKLDGVANTIKFIAPPVGVPDGWDLADDLPEGFNLLQHTKSSAMLIAEFLEQQAQRAATKHKETPPWEGPSAFEQILEKRESEPDSPDIPPAELDEADHLLKNKYFTILGYDHEEYFLFVHGKQQVVSRTAARFNDLGFLELANDINWWEMNFPGNKGGINHKAAASWIIAIAESRGIYDPGNIRGRGAWLDDGRSVFHLGDKLVVDGKEMAIDEISSAFVYPRGKKMPRPSAQPLSKAEGAHLLAVAKQVRWSMQGSALLLAGWAFLAPICGSLKWRPHIWITGGAGSGKSTVQRDFCYALTRGVAKYGQGDSTEAGVRQKLASDALPVLIDEFETNDDKEKARVDGVIAMIRKSSSESEAETMKGTISGDGVSFKVRSMFCLASINTKLDKQADMDRVTKLLIRVPPTDGSQIEHWKKLEAELYDISHDDGLPSRLMARSVSMVPTVLQAVKVFVKVASQRFSSQRMGDQYGTLIAGCWCLTNDHAPSEEEARDVVFGYNWDEHTEDQDQDDAKSALDAILNSKIRMANPAGDVTIDELIREAHSGYHEGLVDQKVASATLKRHGIRVEEEKGVLLFGTNVPNLKALLKNTSCSTDVRGQLLRLPGAIRWNTERFSGASSKCVALPLNAVLEEPTSAPVVDEDDDYPI